jgi:hypothetical protein
MLPGITPGPGLMAGGNKTITSMSERWFIHHNWGDTWSAPTTEAGDLLIMYAQARNSGAAASFNVPAGWVSLAELDNNNYKAAWAYKIADGTETGTMPNVIVQSSVGDPMGMISCFSFDQPLGSVVAFPGPMYWGNGNPPAQVMDPTDASAPVLLFALWGDDIRNSQFSATWSGTTPDFKTNSEPPNNSFDNVYGMRAAQFQGTPDDLAAVTVDMADIGDYLIMQSIYFELSA